MSPRFLSFRRLFLLAAVLVVAGLSVGAASGMPFLCAGPYGGYLPCGGGYGGYGGYGPYQPYGPGHPTLPPVHFTQTPAAETTSHSAAFDWVPDFPPPGGTDYNYDCILDGQPVHDDGSGFECHPPKTLTVGTGSHTFSVAIAGAHGDNGPSATYHWTVTEPPPTDGGGGGGGPPSGGDTPPGGLPTPPPTGTTVPRDVLPPNVTLTFAGNVLSDLQHVLLSGFLPVTVSCDEPCTIDISAFIDSALAKRLGLISRQVAIGRGAKSLPRGGKATVNVKLSKKARKRLRRAKKVTVTLKAVVKDASGNKRTTTKKIVLKRKR